MIRQMRRRDLVLGLAVALATPLPTRALAKRKPVVGALASIHTVGLSPLEDGLADAGFNLEDIAIDARFADDRYDELPQLAAALVRSKVDVIAAFGLMAGLAARRATDTIPIVTWAEADPVAAGLAASLARPGGNVTGILMQEPKLARNRLDLLTELLPQAKRLALLVNPKAAVTPAVIHSARNAARAKGVALRVLQAGSVDDVGAAYATLRAAKADGLIVEGDPWLRILEIDGALVKQAASDRLPAVYGWSAIAWVGGLMTYGVDLDAAKRQLGACTGRVLKGARPGDLPFERAKKVELFVNLKTAKTLALTVPQSLLAQADQVIR